MTNLSRICVLGVASAIVVGLTASVSPAKDPAAPADGTKTVKPGFAPTSRPADFWKNLWNHMPAPIDQTVKKENSPQDKLRIDITHSYLKEGKHVALVRVVWGDLENLIKGGGKEHYSNWDGKLTIDNGTGLVVHKIAFDDGKGLVAKPLAKRAGTTSKPAHKDAVKRESPVFKPALPADKPAAAKHGDRPHNQPGPGSGRDELEQSAGKEIVWEAGVVGALDGLMIKITSDSADITGTIVAGKFTVPFKITGSTDPLPARKPGKADTAGKK